MALYSLWFTGLKTRAKLKEENKKVRFCAQSLPIFLQCFLILYFLCFKLFYSVNHMYIKRDLRFPMSTALCLHMDPLKDKAECSHPRARVLPGWHPLYESIWQKIFPQIIFSINRKWHIQRWKLKCTMFPCASTQSHYSYHNSLHNWLLIYFNTHVWTW